MADKKLEHKILGLFSSHFGIPKEDLKPELDLEQDLNATKLELTDFYSIVENALGINIEEADSLNFKTVSDVTNFVLDHGEFA